MTTYLVLGVQYKYQNLCIGYQVLPKTIRANEISQLSWPPKLRAVEAKKS